MSRMHRLMLAAAGVLLCLPAFAADVRSLLKQADGYRLSSDSARVETEVRVLKQGRLDKTRHYTVYVKPGRRSVVVFRSPGERGQKMLMVGDDFWLVMPTSQRPMRITPMQKLLGDASTGDVATMTWSDDYDGRIDGEATIEGVACLKLDLSVRRRGVSYPRIVLYVAKSDHHPVRAELFVASDKLAKTASFELGERDGRRQVLRMTLIDRLQDQRSTEIRYVSAAPKALPDEYYNPAFLVRAGLED